MRIRIEVEVGNLVFTIERDAPEVLSMRSTAPRSGAVSLLGDAAGRMVVALGAGSDVPIDVLMEAFQLAARNPRS